MPRKGITPAVCAHCGAAFLTWPYKVRAGEGRFCSRRCGASPVRSKLSDRFWAKVDRNPDGCWLWTGSKSSHGYGQLFSMVGGHRAVLHTHRISWELHNGPIPDGLWVLHRCDVRPCVRPDHLFLGTRQDNTDDMMAKGRHRYGTWKRDRVK